MERLLNTVVVILLLGGWFIYLFIFRRVHVSESRWGSIKFAALVGVIIGIFQWGLAISQAFASDEEAWGIMLFVGITILPYALLAGMGVQTLVAGIWRRRKLRTSLSR